MMLGVGTERMEELVTEKTKLLLDYIEKFINQATGSSNPASSSTEARSESLPEGSMEHCRTMSVDVEECVPYINYLDNKKRSQLSGLRKTFELITNYFIMAREKCDNVLNKGRCRKLIVSRSRY